METFAAIVIAAVLVPIVFLAFIIVPILIWFTPYFLSSRRTSAGVYSGDLGEQRLAFG
jgi:hypothetical protein